MSKFVEYIDDITTRLTHNNFKERLIKGKETIAAAYKIGLKKAAAHYKVKCNSDVLDHLKILHFVRGISMPKCIHNKKHSLCKEDCGGSSICEHQRLRRNCNDCLSIKFWSSRNLPVPVPVIATQAPSRQYYCEVCQIGYDNPSSLKRHLITIKHIHNQNILL